MLRFNRYIVECKYKQEKDIKAGEWVLIDTQWNVNVSDCDCVMRTAGFNRYIVEYKFF